jgi:sulfur-oxidizing protein SoxY
LGRGDVIIVTKTVTLAASRRQALSLGLGAAGVVAVFGLTTPSHATNNAKELIRHFTGGKVPAPGKVELELPDIAENGKAVRMAFWVESPMTESSHVTDVLVVANGNARARVATFHFSPASGLARVATRIRLDSTQVVIAVAKMNDGSFYITSKEVTVALGGCCD